ncbi:MAG TPA: Gfo/Idh/MocA family oxidoreductase [Isosphaeraceae bacterium]|jgi:predicted dehydrogenase|nr:Gfo/Idh/MocA family oxidoreductase [Isosphaeraceae bacterium]
MGNGATLRGGLIGCGFVSQYHLAGWADVPGARLVAVCDLLPERLDWARRYAPEAQAFTDAAAMLEAFEDGESGKLDFVEVCTRPESHRELVELAARHGAHVLCQKPAALVRWDLRAMIDACDAAGVRLMFHENWRFRPWYRALKDEIDAGAVGRPIRIRLAHRDTRAIRPEGFAEQPYLADLPRLILMEMGCHLVDTARYLMGEVREVAAMLGRFGEGHPGEDVATLNLRFASGALGLLDISWCAPADLARPEWALNQTVVEGTAGTLRLVADGSLEHVSPRGQLSRRAVPLPPEERVYLDGYNATQAHFIAGLLDGREHETHGTETLKTMDVIWAGYRSAEEGRVIPVLAGPA